MPDFTLQEDLSPPPNLNQDYPSPPNLISMPSTPRETTESSPQPRKPGEFKFNLGADPEFIISFKGRQLIANNAVPLLIDKANSKLGNMGFDIPNAGNIGWDGHNSTAEIRPLPAKSPKQIVSHIGTLFGAVTKKAQIFQFETSTLRENIGGHIHFEIDKNQSPDIIKKIHFRLAAFYMPLMMGENKLNLSHRAENYGKIDDYRYDEHNVSANLTTLEFRVPSAEWLTTPQIAEATLAYLGVVFHEILNNPNFTKDYKQVIWANKKQAELVHQLVLSDYTEMSNVHCNLVKKAVKKFTLYKEFAEQIEYITNAKKVLADKEKVGYDIIKGWKLSSPKPTKKQLMNNKYIESKSAELDVETLSEIIPIQYNDDAFVATFCHELKKRIIGTNWQLNNNYFLFGLKNGVEDFIVFNKKGKMLYDGGQIKTQQDINIIAKTTDKMCGRFNTVGGYRTDKEKESLFDKHILIGIPYKMRTAMNIKPFIEKVFEVEENKFKANYLDFASYPHTNDSERDDGTLYNIYRKENEPIAESLSEMAQGEREAITYRSEAMVLTTA